MTTRFRIKLAKEISQKWPKGVDTELIKTQAVDQAGHKCKIQPLKWTLRSGLGDWLRLGLGARWAAALHPDLRGGGGGECVAAALSRPWGTRRVTRQGRSQESCGDRGRGRAPAGIARQEPDRSRTGSPTAPLGRASVPGATYVYVTGPATPSGAAARGSGGTSGQQDFRPLTDGRSLAGGGSSGSSSSSCSNISGGGV